MNWDGLIFVLAFCGLVFSIKMLVEAWRKGD